MQEIVECVMNVSEGRNLATLKAITDEIQAIENSFLLHVCSDPDHHRSVVSFMGTPASIVRAAFFATTKAVELIDLTKHQGVHPRIGAVDVVPFVPIREVSMEQCVNIARQLGEQVGLETGIPVFLYGQAATRPGFENLAQIRKGGSEKLGELIESDPDQRPDFGPARIHPTAGAMAIGARPLLIAFNIIMNSSRVDLAHQIAGKIRESGGGLTGVKALGFHLAQRNRAQVSMNVTNYRQSPLLEIFNRVRQEAHRLGIGVEYSEIIGLAPQNALEGDAVRALQLHDFHPDQILENSIRRALENQESEDRR
ncbi:MAG: glutamate formimidoyltransferase [Acidobacteriota bacterium]